MYAPDFLSEDTVFQTTADLGDGRGFEKCPVWTAAGDCGSDGENRFACEEGDIDRRSTNELRFMTVFSRKPSSTWENLKVKLKLYQRYGGNRSGENWAALEQLEQQLKQCGWNTDIPLGSIYLHGYYEERNK